MATINTAADSTSVNNAIASASNGDTVLLPLNGSGSWSSAVTIPNTKGITLNGNNSAISLNIIQTLFLNQGSSVSSRITNFRFTQTVVGQGSIQILSDLNIPFRYDNCTLTSTGSNVMLLIYGFGVGLIDHCQLTGDPASEMIHNLGNGDPADTTGYSTDVVPGSPLMIYIEDCTFTCAGSSTLASGIENFYGARVVLRHNHFHFSQIDVHGNSQPGSTNPTNEGTRWFEIYNNDFNDDGKPQASNISIRGGSGVIFSNTATWGATNPEPNLNLREDSAGSYHVYCQAGTGLNQNVSPVYGWNNYTDLSTGSSVIQLNRDFFTTTGAQQNPQKRFQKSGDTSSTTYTYAPFQYPYPLDANLLPNPSGSGGTVTISGLTGSIGVTGAIVPTLRAYIYGPTLIPWYEPAPTQNLYIAPRVDGLAGSGTAIDPKDASTQAKFDSIILGAASGTAIYYATGVYLTNGYQPGGTRNALPHIYHVGAGIDQTIIRLSPSAPEAGNAGRILLFGGDYNERCDGFQIWNMTLDCNADNNAAYLGTGGCNIMAVNLQGNNVMLYGLKIIGYGISIPNTENFTVSLQPNDNGFPNSSWSHGHVENCLFTLPSIHNQGGNSALCMNPPSGITATDWRGINNTFLNITSNFQYSHALCTIDGWGNTINGASTGCYMEPNTPGDNNLINPIRFSFNTFSSCPFVCQASMHATGVTTPILFSHNAVTLPPSGFVIGVVMNGDAVTTIPAIPSWCASFNTFGGTSGVGAAVGLTGGTTGSIGTVYVNDNVTTNAHPYNIDTTVSNVQFCRNTGSTTTLTGYTGNLLSCTAVTPPSTPVVTVGAVTGNSVSISWSSSTDTASGALGNTAAQLNYVVQRKTGAGGTYANVYYPFGDSPTCTWLDRTVVGGTTYFYQVAAMDNLGNLSSFSTPVSATTTGGTITMTPTLVQHVATGMERNPLGTFNLTLPNPVKAGNCLIAAFQYNGSNSTSVTSITSVPSGTWVLGGSAANASFSNVAIYYLLNATAGITSITITMAGLSTQEAAMQGAFSEFNNIVTASALDVAISSPTLLNPGTLSTTSTTGDLVYHFAINGSATSANGGNYNSTTPIVAGAGFTLLSADLQTGAVVQIATPTGPGNVVPTFTKSGSDTWESVAIALKASSSAQGSPASGFYIGKVTHTLIYSIAQSHTPTTCVLQYPYSGNLLVSSFDSANETIGSITDSAGNTWLTAASTTGPGAFNCSDIHYSQNINQNSSPSNLITVNLVINGALALSDIMFTVYDIHGAATAAFDKSITEQGTNNTANPVGGFNQLTELSLANNFFPSTPSGIVIAGDSHQFTSTVGIVGTGYIFGSVWNNLNHNIGGGTPTSTLDEDNARGHIFNTDTSPVNFIFNGNLATDPYGSWSISVAAFKAATGGTNVIQGPLNSTLASGGAITRAYGAAMTAHSLLVCFINWGAATGTVTGVSDTLNGAWTLAKVEQGNLTSSDCYYVLNGAQGSAPTVTVTFGASVTGPELVIYEVAPATGQFWFLDGTPNGATGTASPTTGSITTAGSNDLLFACYSGAGVETAATPGFSLYETNNANSIGLQFVTTPGTYSCTWTTATSTNACLIAGFKTGSSTPVTLTGLTGNISVTGLLKLTLAPKITGNVNLTGVLAPTSDLPNLIGSITFAGTIMPSLAHHPTGSIGVTGITTLQSVGAGPLTGNIAVSGVVNPTLVLSSLAGSVTVSATTTATGAALPHMTGSVTVSASTTVQPVAFVNNQSGTIEVSGSINPNLAGLTGSVTVLGATTVQPTAFVTSQTGSITLSGATTVQPTAFANNLRGSVSVAGTVTVTGSGTTLTIAGLSGSIGVSGLVTPSISEPLTGALSVTGALPSPLALLQPTLSGALALTGLMNPALAPQLAGAHGVIGIASAQYVGTISHGVSGTVALSVVLAPTLVLPSMSGALSVTGTSTATGTALPTGSGAISVSGTLNPTLILSGNIGTVGVSGVFSPTISGTLTLAGLTGSLGVTSALTPSLVLPSLSGAMDVTGLVNPALGPIVNGTVGAAGVLSLTLAPGLTGQVSVTGAAIPSIALHGLSGAMNVSALVNPTETVLALPNLDGTVSVPGLVNPTLATSGNTGTVAVSGVLSVQFSGMISLDGLVGSVSTSALFAPSLGFGMSGAMSLLGVCNNLILGPTGAGTVGISGMVRLILSAGPPPPLDITIKRGDPKGSWKVR